MHACGDFVLAPAMATPLYWGDVAMHAVEGAFAMGGVKPFSKEAAAAKLDRRSLVVRLVRARVG